MHQNFVLLAFIGFCSFFPSIDAKHLRTSIDSVKYDDERDLQTDYCTKRSINFDRMVSGDIMNKQFHGVTIFGNELSRQGNAAIILDTHRQSNDNVLPFPGTTGTVRNPQFNTQGGTFPFNFGNGNAFDNQDFDILDQEKVLILSGDGNTKNPRSSSHGGTFTFTFDTLVQMESLIFVNIAFLQFGEIKLFDNKKRQLNEFKITATANNKQIVVDLANTPHVKTMTVRLIGSGGIDDVTYRTPECNSGVADASEDFGVRFSKVNFDNTGVVVPTDFFPLGTEDFPPKGQTDLLLRQSNAHSVVTQDDFEVKRSIIKIIETVGGLPTHANGDPHSPFWEEFAEVIQAQKDRRNQVPAPNVFPLARIWFDYDLEDVAEAVHDEFPGTNQAIFMSTLLDDPNFKLDDTIIPRRCRGAFLRRDVMMADLNTWAIGVVAPYNFGAKWHGGRARPEEIAWLITTGDLTVDDGVPAKIVDDVLSFGLTKATDFTAYPEGCPPHPSWPAMHSAASSSSFLLSVILDLNEEQLCQVKLVDYGVSFARTVAGVHYRSDNIDGLNMGQEVLAHELGRHLESKYGSDRSVVEKKIKKMRFNWKEFDPWECKRKFG